MFSIYLKSLSILKKFLFINFIIFTIIGLFTIIYLNNIQPNLIKKKSINHINIINNTVDNLLRLEVKFVTEDIRKFLFSTRFIFQNLDRVIFFDNDLNLIGDTDTLDLDPRAFSTRLNDIEFESLNEKKINKENKDKSKNVDEKKFISFELILKKYVSSDEYGDPFTFAKEDFNQFKLTTIKNVTKEDLNIGYILITENANDIKVAIDERKAFVIRTAISVGFVILIFSFVLSRYFIKPIQNLVSYTKNIKEKSHEKLSIDNLKNRNDELGLLSNSLEDMTTELQKRVAHAENFSTDLVHEIRNPLASLKSASEILKDTNSSDQRLKLLNILSHDVLRIERLITDYSQMLKDEVALSNEKIEKINVEPIIESVVDDFNSIYNVKKGINIKYKNDGKKEYFINGIENRIEQIIANLLDNSISFTKKGGEILVDVSLSTDNKIIIKIIDEGQGFKEKDTSKIFNRFYSNRPEKFGEHSGLGLNIVKNLVDLHDGKIVASNRLDGDGAIMEISFPTS
ncbi:two-component sensor histidine kinase [Candidatus Pelagibacter sp. HTCC7211]|uniref:sensor histidine kinase n=1 Tax=Pelagibacter sp. (strain HTCC7211) TaxID=439493 RepID=UPI000183ACA4|nr:HAMP domain-containing sensor histidine kinase [Candidatus Pelagibacter sp. HTCC7211]EDZ60813.1 two-component sensor histidine kinase [Candidatus Pelagibacter sp. HTCC7211]MBD1150814.1 HAMP domain-containing histidine kinase [Pelagibacterales bacterium SAG-MED25]